MKKGSTTIIALFVLLAINTSAILAQTSGDAKVEIRGTVEDTDGSAIPNATVAIYNQTETEILTGTSTERDGSMFVGSGISKELFNRKATISLSVRDLLNSRQYDGEIINSNSLYRQ